MVVNIYIYQTIKGPKARPGAYTYILETIVGGKACTLSKTAMLEAMTENKAELTAVLEAMKRIRKTCDIRLIGVNGYIRLGLQEWLDKWAEKQWKTAKGMPISNADEWKQLYEYSQKYLIEVEEQAEHTYKEWMIAETEKELGKMPLA